jgi:aminopeptidase N
MLRSIVGDDALKQALQTYLLDPTLDRDPIGLQRALEKLSHKDLRWFFDDWVYRDRGLPDLSIVSVTPSQLTSRAGLPAGWLIAVEVRNDGYAAAEVPVTVRSSTASETQRLRIPGRSSASTRIVFAGTPAEVEVNDGGVPETQTTLHTRQLLLPSH